MPKALTRGCSRRFNASSVAVTPRMADPVPALVMTELLEQFDELRKAYDPNGLKPSEFGAYGATARTLRGLLGSSYEPLAFLRDLGIPNP